MASLGVFVFNSMGAAYFALNDCLARKTLQVIEFTPLGQQAQLLVRGEDSEVDHFLKDIREGELKTTHLVRNIQQDVLNAYFSITNHPVNAALLIVDSGSLGTLIEIANQMISPSVKIVDIRMPRAPGAWGNLLLTSDDPKDLSKVRDLIENYGSSITFKLIKQTTPEFCNYFGSGPVESSAGSSAGSSGVGSSAATQPPQQW